MHTISTRNYTCTNNPGNVNKISQSMRFDIPALPSFPRSRTPHTPFATNIFRAWIHLEAISSHGLHLSPV